MAEWNSVSTQVAIDSPFVNKLVIQIFLSYNRGSCDLSHARNKVGTSVQNNNRIAD